MSDYKEQKKIEYETRADGKRVNPNIPHFIANAPWYSTEGHGKDGLQQDGGGIGTGGDKAHKSSIKHDEWYDRSNTVGKDSTKSTKTKYKKGACTNCGSMSHKAKDCLERPRAVGAKFNNKNIREDETVEEVATTWESKRDRWTGFRSEDYEQIVRESESQRAKKLKTNGQTECEDQGTEQDRRTECEKQGAAQQAQDDKTECNRDQTNNPPNEDEWYEKEIKWETHQSVINPTAWKSSRDRHDKAHYLQSLTSELGFDEETKTYKGEKGELNARGFFERELEGHGLEHRRLRELAALAAKKGHDVNLETNPTASYMKLKEQLNPESTERTSSSNNDNNNNNKQTQKVAPPKIPKSLLERYGGMAHVKSEVPVGQQPTQQQPEPPTETPYGNHTRLWGTFVVNGRPGYACCHSDVKHSVCLGAKGIAINDEKYKQQQPKEPTKSSTN